MSRSIFEEVGDSPARRGGPAPGEAETRKRRVRRWLAIWLSIVALMVVAQIVLGGLTRLTDSGLSITEWRPVTGVLPPFSEQGWSEEFARYQQTTEFQQQNARMTLAEFKRLYLWEWLHRLWGRLIGVVFLAPLAWLAWRKAIPPGWGRRLLVLGGLGLAQGVIGWWMVVSGLTGRLDVSQHRLAVHLGLAFVILGYLLWCALSLRREEWALLQARRRRDRGLLIWAGALGGLLFVQIILGAYVAGLDAGVIYGQWPSMGDGFYPSGEPYRPFSEPAAAQFTHRLAAYALVIATLWFWLRARRAPAARTRWWAVVAGGGVLAQAALGVLTLLHAAPVGLAAAHLLMAIALFSSFIVLAHQIAYPAEQSLRE